MWNLCTRMATTDFTDCHGFFYPQMTQIAQMTEIDYYLLLLRGTLGGGIILG